MSTPKLLLALAALAMVAGCAALRGSPPAMQPGALGIGRAPTPEELRGWDIDVRADGAGLPPGSGTVAAGKGVYDAKCASCHGAAGAGGAAPALVGGIGSLASPRPVRTIGSFWPYATTVYDYVFRAMPWDKPMSLSSNEVYAVTAYLLHANQLIPADAVMNAQTLPAVRMPNRDGFVHTQAEPSVQGARCMRDC